MTTVRTLLAVATAQDWSLLQLDVNNVFLHSDLNEEVYMSLPSEFYDETKVQGKVCKLRKSLYGLKQASRQWFAKLNETLLEFDFSKSEKDHSLFTVKRNVGNLLIMPFSMMLRSSFMKRSGNCPLLLLQ